MSFIILSYKLKIWACVALSDSILEIILATIIKYFQRCTHLSLVKRCYLCIPTLYEKYLKIIVFGISFLIRLYYYFYSEKLILIFLY